MPQGGKMKHLLMAAIVTVCLMLGVTPSQAQEIQPTSLASGEAFKFELPKYSFVMGEQSSLMFATSFDYTGPIAYIVVDVTTNGLAVYGKDCQDPCIWQFTNIDTGVYPGMSNTYSVTTRKEGKHTLTARFRQYGFANNLLKEETITREFTVAYSKSTVHYFGGNGSVNVTIINHDGLPVRNIMVKVVYPNGTELSAKTNQYGEVAWMGLTPAGNYTVTIETAGEIIEKTVVGDHLELNITYKLRVSPTAVTFSGLQANRVSLSEQLCAFLATLKLF